MSHKNIWFSFVLRQVFELNAKLSQYSQYIFLILMFTLFFFQVIKMICREKARPFLIAVHVWLLYSFLSSSKFKSIENIFVQIGHKLSQDKLSSWQFSNH